ncbi:MAG: hypothetical protein JWM10_3191 [Myxococcaceae bacterium]|nr:hypothetical protein [Myxococcaceae bacterium]
MTPNGDEIKVMFCFLIVRLDAFSVRSYPGGFEEFASRFSCLRKDQIAAVCTMSHQELEPITEDLKNNGFDGLDFFEGMWDGISESFIAQDPSMEQEIRLTEWLLGRHAGEVLLVRLAK